MKRYCLTILLLTSYFLLLPAQRQYAVMDEAPVSATRWTTGFWADRFRVLAGSSLTSMWATWQSPEGKGWNNFLIASGEKQGKHHGPPFHDGDMYKWLEAVASVYAVNRDPALAAIMDRFIGAVAKAQRADGYIHTPVVIAEMNRGIDSHALTADNGVVGTKVGTGADGAFGNRLNFETYNLGHLMTAGVIHHRATGKRTLLDCSIRAANFLCDFYDRASDELARNAICPSHYMGVVELYRETGDKRYLELAKHLIDIRGQVENGTDDNQDRIPFRKQYQAMGHAVRANYLYAGVADLYLEDGEPQLWDNLTAIWRDITYRKMYINGACGALYDGTSPDGTNYTPDSIQKVHQAYGRPYQLPQSTAHNETCANIGNMLLNWRMFQATADGKYMDIVENCLLNSVLPGISLDGERYFYVNPLRLSADLPYTLRWPKERKRYISCFCCPPNTLRTLCQAQHYAYSTSDSAVYVNAYGASEFKTAGLTLTQQTEYPWQGDITLTVSAIKGRRDFALKLRVPGWCTSYTVAVDGEQVAAPKADKGYLTLRRTWRKGDVVTLRLDMPARLIEANPLVEEARGQVAVQRGPVIYCLESQDTGGTPIDNVLLTADADFRTVPVDIDGCHITALETTATVRQQQPWTDTLYRPLQTATTQRTIRLIPYFAWGNRGKGEMSVYVQLANSK